MVDAEQLEDLYAEQLREVTLRRIKDFAEQQSPLEAEDRSIETLTRKLTFKCIKLDQLTQELAHSKRLRFRKSSEKLDAVQASLLDESSRHACRHAFSSHGNNDGTGWPDRLARSSC